MYVDDKLELEEEDMYDHNNNLLAEAKYFFDEVGESRRLPTPHAHNERGSLIEGNYELEIFGDPINKPLLPSFNTDVH